MAHLAEYDPSWPDQFDAEASRLRGALGERVVEIDHVGSTAIPGLAAKPIIDIQVTVASSVEVDACKDALEAVGYTFTVIPLPYFHRPDDWPHTHHVHVRPAGGEDARRMIAFRDWLRTHPADRRAYEALKRRLARDSDWTTVEGRSRYSKAKTEFVRAIEEASRESPS